MNQNYESSNAGGLIIVSENENGCLITEEINITIDTIAPDLEITLDESELNCTINEIGVEVNTMDNGLQYDWSGPNLFMSDESEPILTDAGTYNLQVTGSNGCTVEFEWEITIDTLLNDILLGGEDLTCSNNTSILGYTDSMNFITSQWLGPNGEFISNEVFVEISEGGVYTLAATQENGCVVIDSISIEDERVEVIIDLIADSEIIDCNNTLVTLTIESNVELEPAYFWQHNGDIINILNSTLTVNEPGLYTITAGIGGSCSDTDSLELFIDTISPSPNIIINPFDCENQELEIILENIEEDSIFFNDIFSDDGIFIESINEANFVDILAISDNGCTFDTMIFYETFEVLEVSTIDTIFFDTDVNVQLEVQHNREEDEISSIIWSPANLLSCENCLDPFYTAGVSQLFTVTITDIFGCEITREIFLSLIDLSTPKLYIPNAFNPDNSEQRDIRFKGLTNPSNVELIDHFSIYDRWGNEILLQENIEYSDPEYGWDGTYNGKGVQQGVYAYVLMITFENGANEIYKGTVSVLR